MTNTKTRTSSPIGLNNREMVKSFRMLRNGRDGKLELTLSQIACAESLFRLAMEFDPTNPFRNHQTQT